MDTKVALYLGAVAFVKDCFPSNSCKLRDFAYATSSSYRDTEGLTILL